MSHWYDWLAITVCIYAVQSEFKKIKLKQADMEGQLKVMSQNINALMHSEQARADNIWDAVHEIRSRLRKDGGYD